MWILAIRHPRLYINRNYFITWHMYVSHRISNFDFLFLLSSSSLKIIWSNKATRGRGDETKAFIAEEEQEERNDKIPRLNTWTWTYYMYISYNHLINLFKYRYFLPDHYPLRTSSISNDWFQFSSIINRNYKYLDFSK